jgi:hypothetical protein
MNHEKKLIGLEVGKIINNKYNKIDSLLYSPNTNNIYNIIYIGNTTNFKKMHLFNKNNINYIVNIIKSYEHYDNILNTIYNLEDKIILNEIEIDNVYIFMNKYSNNINDFILYYSKKYIKYLFLLFLYLNRSSIDVFNII